MRCTNLLFYGRNVMDKEEFKEKFKFGMEKVVESSKKALAQAGSAVQDFSDKSVIRIEIHQLESKRDEQVKLLGDLAMSRFLAEGTQTLSSDEEAVSAILEEVKKLDKDIAEHNEKLKAEKKEE